MPLRRSKPYRFTPKGLSDAYDASEAFPGACRALTNLVFDPSNPELVVCRPGVVKLTNFTGFTTPTAVTVHIAIGGVVYGMVSSGRNAGKDEPFAYNVGSNTFTTISGVTAGNTPTSPATTGAWTPPTMSVIGTKIIVTHPGFNGTGANFFGVIDISTPSAPTWTSSNLATNALPSVPTAVANFNNRAWYACGNVVYYSDVLNATTRTNASQSVTLGDPTSVTGFVGLPVQTTSSGVTQALMCFKQFQIWQVTGDTATSNLAVSYLSLTLGSIAPRSIVPTPFGVVFIAPDGPYIVDALGGVNPLTRSGGKGIDIEQDVQQPFINATTPSRISAGFSAGIYRICVDTIVNGSAATNEYWFDRDRRRWNGPHSWPQDCASQVGNYFVISHVTKGANLYKSEITASQSTVYTDDGASISFTLQSCTFPKDDAMLEKMVVESTIELATAGAALTYQLTALDDQGSTLGSANVTANSTTSVWGAFLWGVGKWSQTINVPHVYTVPWAAPLVFQKMAIQVNSTSQSNVSIGCFSARYQFTGYTNQQ